MLEQNHVCEAYRTFELIILVFNTNTTYTYYLYNYSVIYIYELKNNKLEHLYSIRYRRCMYTVQYTHDVPYAYIITYSKI